MNYEIRYKFSPRCDSVPMLYIQYRAVGSWNWKWIFRDDCDFPIRRVWPDVEWSIRFSYEHRMLTLQSVIKNRCGGNMEEYVSQCAMNALQSQEQFQSRRDMALAFERQICSSHWQRLMIHQEESAQ